MRRLERKYGADYGKISYGNPERMKE